MRATSGKSLLTEPLYVMQIIGYYVIWLLRICLWRMYMHII